jgi:hypothetical protein
MRNLAAALFRLENSQGPEPVRAVVSALADWLADPQQVELRRSFVIWLHEAFFKTRLPAVQFPELSTLEEIRIMLTDRVLDWTQQWKQEGLQQGRQEGRQEGLHSERRALLRLIHRRFGDSAADRSAPTLEQIVQPPILEDLFENLLDCADESAWLARLNAVVDKEGHGGFYVEPWLSRLAYRGCILCRTHHGDDIQCPPQSRDCLSEKRR